MLSLKLLLAAVMAGFVVAQTTTSSSTSASSSGSSSSSDNTNFDVTNIDRTRRSKHIERLWIFKLHADHDEQLHGARTKPPIVPFCVAGKLQPPLPSDRMVIDCYFSAPPSPR